MRFPFSARNLAFEYEVVEQGEYRTVTYEDRGQTCTYDECTLILRSLGCSIAQEFICTLCGKDAFKVLRPGEIISAELSFHTRKNERGEYEQYVCASELFTLEEYYKLRDAGQNKEKA